MDGTPKPLCDWLPAFWRDSVPLVAETRGAEYGCETVKCAVADKCLFAGTGRYSNVRERLEQLVELSLADRASRGTSPGRSISSPGGKPYRTIKGCRSARSVQ